MKEQPELLLVSGMGPDNPVMLSLVSQLLETGVHFVADTEQGLPRELPADLQPYRAIVFDGPAFVRAVGDPATCRRMENYVGAGGYITGMEDPFSRSPDAAAGPLPVFGLAGKKLTDLTTSNRVYGLISHAGLSRFSTAFRKDRLALTDERIRAEMKAFLMPRTDRAGVWDEFTLHFWKAAKAFADAGDEDLRAALLSAVRKQAAVALPDPFHHDVLSGFFAIPWLADQTGDREPLQRLRELMDRVITRRPRIAGMLSGCGYTDAPLKYSADRIPNPCMVGAGLDHRVVWTEILHFHGPTFASLTRATGDRRYLDEAVRLVDYLAEYHLRPDGLLAHCTRDGLPVAGAWGRGQTHAMYGMLYMLEEMDSRDPAFAGIVRLLARMGHGLKPYQDPVTGLWRNLVDHPDARLETTSTCGIVAVLGRCVREGWLPAADFSPMLRRAWEGLKLMYWRGGLCAGCRGTATGGDPSYYLARPQGWSVVPQLAMAALEATHLQELEGGNPLPPHN